MKRLLLTVLVVLLYLSHQDFWHWRVAKPIVFGLFPIGYFYHILFTILISVVMWVLVRFAWPAALEELVDQEDGRGGQK
ncbi:MAG: DUF3311 domain-containing protein [Acidobacteriota bacterium]|jgi:small-conductance mechanosensitive channel